MRPLSTSGRQAINDIAQRHGFGVDATLGMLDALVAGNGTMAQFNHPEFAGPGQWMRGGMTMISDMFDGALKRRVDSLCRELSDFVADRPERFHGGGCESRHPSNGWPADPGPPDSTGSQNGVRYAYFAQACRLVIEVDGKATVHDTLDHRIGGCSQQPSEGGTPSFTSQHGRIDLASLPVISSDRARPRVPEPDGSIERPRFDDGPRGSAPSGDARELLATIEKIADLHARGILNDDEFAHKKVELLARL